ncbi:hypothetical protein EVAR_61461_1 [Eumeta japonica]|uniref:Uncharacterized protein n=1 Tax=Eumeta variegata TaxID=151549 RepID=A0A4C1Z3R0_EUMVA|nr:hypothetical protein EVAR_61461_1 [Eumeta japonica]
MTGMESWKGLKIESWAGIVIEKQSPISKLFDTEGSFDILLETQIPIAVDKYYGPRATDVEIAYVLDFMADFRRGSGRMLSALTSHSIYGRYRPYVRLSPRPGVDTAQGGACSGEVFNWTTLSKHVASSRRLVYGDV